LVKYLNLARRCSGFWFGGKVLSPRALGKMSEKVLGMVKTSIESLRKHDVKLAETISKPEKEVDDMYFRYLDELVKRASGTSKCTISSVLIVRYLERIADHATYICEAVIYVATDQKVIEITTLANYLQEGWKFISLLPDSKCVIERTN